MKEILPDYILETNVYCVDAANEDMGIEEDPYLVPMAVDLREVSALRLADEDDAPPKGGTVLFGGVAAGFSLMVEAPYEEVKRQWLRALNKADAVKKG